jgi:hypothetical protein
MFLPLARLQDIATQVAAELDPALDVSVSRTEGDSGYAEVLLTLNGCSDEPCQTLIGIDREQSEPEFRAMLVERLGTQLGILKAHSA